MFAQVRFWLWGLMQQMAGIMGVDENFEAVGIYDSWLDTRCEPYIKEMKSYAGRKLSGRQEEP